MLVNLFNFDLPKEKIAKHPVYPRDNARMLVISQDAYQDKHVYDLADLLKEGDLLVFNDTKVIPVRLWLKQQSRGIEITLHKQVSNDSWKAFAKPARKLLFDQIAYVNDNFYLELISKGDNGEVTVKFNLGGAQLIEALNKYGAMPLPPYIKRAKGGDKKDFIDYQTIFAKNEGAVAAPTASLHFTSELMDKLRLKKINHAFVTLHVGAGTYLPVKVSDTDDHIMHYEYGMVSKSTADIINQTKKSGGRIVAVGTTVTRILETATGDDGVIKEFSGNTNIFITPKYKFKLIDLLMTNFHLPESTLFMLVCSIAGIERMKDAYNHAIKNNYRFYSFGDSCLIERLTD